MSNIVGDVQSAPQTFSSWDSCMQKAYCKWPAIVGIIIGALVVLGVLWCVASCLCCGASACGSCMRCFGCCGRSGGGGGGSSRRNDNYSQMPPTPYAGYQPPPAPMSYQPAAPQYARFDENSKGGRVNEDSLPAMPTWANATSHHVEDEHALPPPSSNRNSYRGNDVEMGRMAPSPINARTGYSQVPTHPVSPQPLSPNAQNAYFEGQQPQGYGHESDLGAQRIPHDLGPDDVHNTPMSPAPTYRTDDVMGGVVTSDRFATHSPTPQEYTQSHTQPPLIGQAISSDRFTAHSPTPQEYGNRNQMQPMGAALSSGRYGPPQQGYNPGPRQPRLPQMQPPSQQPFGARQQEPTLPNIPLQSQTQTQPRQHQYSGSGGSTNYNNTRYSPPESPPGDSPYADTGYQSYGPPRQQPPQHQREPSYGYSSRPQQQQQPPQSQQSTRPPSLLQVGRKAIPGSQREV